MDLNTLRHVHGLMLEGHDYNYIARVLGKTPAYAANLMSHFKYGSFAEVADLVVYKNFNLYTVEDYITIAELMVTERIKLVEGVMLFKTDFNRLGLLARMRKNKGSALTYDDLKHLAWIAQESIIGQFGSVASIAANSADSASTTDPDAIAVSSEAAPQAKAAQSTGSSGSGALGGTLTPLEIEKLSAHRKRMRALSTAKQPKAKNSNSAPAPILEAALHELTLAGLDDFSSSAFFSTTEAPAAGTTDRDEAAPDFSEPLLSASAAAATVTAKAPSEPQQLSLNFEDESVSSAITESSSKSEGSLPAQSPAATAAAEEDSTGSEALASGNETATSAFDDSTVHYEKSPVHGLRQEFRYPASALLDEDGHYIGTDFELIGYVDVMSPGFDLLPLELQLRSLRRFRDEVKMVGPLIDEFLFGEP